MRRLSYAFLLLVLPAAAIGEEGPSPLVSQELLDIPASPYDPDSIVVPGGESAPAEDEPFAPLPDAIVGQPAEPDLAPPAIDAWVDVSFTDSSVDFANVGGDAWHW